MSTNGVKLVYYKLMQKIINLIFLRLVQNIIIVVPPRSFELDVTYSSVNLKRSVQNIKITQKQDQEGLFARLIE